MKALNFSAEKKGFDAADRDSIELPINGEMYYIYRPTTNSVALYYTGIAQKNAGLGILAIQEFLEKCVEPEAWEIILKAVKEEVIDFEYLVDMAQDVITEFAANPPTSSKSSSSSRATTGNTSTANSRRPASTRATSRSRASAT